MILIDLQKAYQTSYHNLILLDKIKYIGFSGKTKWFHCYLTNRAFLISLDNFFPETGSIDDGVPQESLLGTSIFVILPH